MPVQVLDLETGETTKYTSARKAAEALNISNSTVIRKLQNPSKPFFFKPKKRYVFQTC